MLWMVWKDKKLFFLQGFLAPGFNCTWINSKIIKNVLNSNKFDFSDNADVYVFYMLAMFREEKSLFSTFWYSLHETVSTSVSNTTARYLIFFNIGQN